MKSWKPTDGSESQTHELVLRGGRVIDPDSGLDAVRDVAVDGDIIARVSAQPLRARTVVDISGLVVCPGFIDLHSHSQSLMDLRLRVLDGVTTALELECGAHPVETAYQRAAAEGRPIHFGFSASWALARISCLTGNAVGGAFPQFLPYVSRADWQRKIDDRTLRAVLNALELDLSAGAVGIGVLLGYAPSTHPSEFLAVAALAARRNVAVFTHARDIADADAAVDGTAEIGRVADETGAHLHFCHLNSMALRRLDAVMGMIEHGRQRGGRITTEAYPYGAGMTGIGADFLAPDRLAPQGLAPSDVLFAPTGERVVDAAHLEHLRRTSPEGLCFVDHFHEDDPADFAWIERTLAVPGTAVASDAIPLSWRGRRPAPITWPPPAGAITHPRTAGTFGRMLRLARGGRPFTLPEAISRCTVVPASVLTPSVPAMDRKARVQAGCDADLVVFDPERVTDQATYLAPTRPTTGIRHVIVAGEFVVRDGELRPEVLPGRAVRAAG